MAIVDEQGRLFGRLNLVDAILALLVLGLIPLAYGAYLLFKTPLPTLTRVEPATLFFAQQMRLTVRGENLRPYMRVSLGQHQGQTFLFKDTTEAEIGLPAVPPGVYDVVLYDYSQERARLPRALTIAPSPLPDARMVAVGMFGNLKPEQVSRITAGMVIPEVGEVLAVGRPVPQVTRVFVRPGTVEIPVPNAQMVPATLQLGCHVRSNQGQPECFGGEFSLQLTTLLFLPTPAGTVPFQIDQLRGLQPLEPVRVTVRFSGNPDILAAIRQGDVDLGDVRNELSAGGAVGEVLSPAGASSRDVRLTVQAQRGVTGWTYQMAPLRIGSAFVLRTPRYEVQGTVIALAPQSF